MRDRDDVAFVINGGGSALSGLRDAAIELPNVVFVPYQPPERLCEVLAAGDVHVVPLKRGLAKASGEPFTPEDIEVIGDGINEALAELEAAAGTAAAAA